LKKEKKFITDLLTLFIMKIRVSVMNFKNKSFEGVLLSGCIILLTVTLSGCILFPSGTLNLLLTDPAVTDLENVWVTITHIEVYRVDDTEEENPIIVYDRELIVDLLDIQWPDTIDLGSIGLEEGQYNGFKMYISEAWADEDGDGPELPFECNVPPGKLNVPVVDFGTGEESFFIIVGGGETTVVIDIAWNNNMAKNPNNNLNPVCKAFVSVEPVPEP